MEVDATSNPPYLCVGPGGVASRLALRNGRL
jgi:hypothetical protein